MARQDSRLRRLLRHWGASLDMLKPPVLRLFFTVLLLMPLAARAHEMPKSNVLLDMRSREILAELRLPIDRLQVAMHHDPAAKAGLHNLPAVRAYVLAHILATAPDGRAWTVQVTDLAPASFDDVPELIVHLLLLPPEGAAADVVDLQYEVINRELVTHAALVSVRSDWRSGMPPGSTQLLGTIGMHNHAMLIDRSGGSIWRGASSIFRLGMRHIAEGTDHLLFLLTLLLPAPLLAVQGRWRGIASPKHSILRVAQIVTAFTVGHSLTLLLGALALVRVPSEPIEFLIAASIFVSAVHALRPLFAGREFLIAASFGLVHGLSFAEVIGELGLDRWGMAVGIASFNLGIEAMQLFVVVMTMPWLLMLSRTRLYPGVRIGGACFAMIASIGWMLERSTTIANPVGFAVEDLATHAGWLVMALALTAILTVTVSAFVRPPDKFPRRPERRS